MVTGRGGHREGAGRKSNWVSSSDTTAIRIPTWMVPEILSVARRMDVREEVNLTEKVDELKVVEILEKWKQKTEGKENSPRWKNVGLLISEIEEKIN